MKCGKYRMIVNLNRNVIELYLCETRDLKYIIAIPNNLKDGSELFVETYNSCGVQRKCYDDNVKDAVSENGNNIEKLIVNIITDFPVVMPIVPNLVGLPDCQQLSLEAVCDFRIHEKVYECIRESMIMIKKITSKKVKNKIFLNGYSSSGVFAQRFALIYPEIISRCLIGGAAGTIPVPSTKFNFPIGIGDYYNLFNKKFDFLLYKKIKFGYYVGEEEEIDLYQWKKRNRECNSTSVYAELPTHDMSLRERTTPKKIGDIQRKYLGQSIDQRYANSIAINKKFGIEIEGIIIRGVNHRNIFDGKNIQLEFLSEQLLDFIFCDIQLNPRAKFCCNHIREFE